jgi:general secretion pathway protein B
MSYILEALRKSERERREVEEEPLVRLAAAPGAPQKSAWKAVIVGLSVIANLAALAYFIGPLAPVHREEAQPNAAAAANGPKVMPMAADQEYRGSEQSPGLAKLPVPAERVLEASNAPRKEAARGPSIGKDKVQPSSLGARPSRPPSVVSPTRQPKDFSKPREAITMSRASRTPSQTEIVSQPPDKKAGTAGTPPTSERDFLRLGEPHNAPREGLPNPKINVYAYSPKSGDDRFVVIRNRKYREGDRTEEGPVVRRIEEEGMTLEFDGQTYKVPRP